MSRVNQGYMAALPRPNEEWTKSAGRVDNEWRTSFHFFSYTEILAMADPSKRERNKDTVLGSIV